MTVTANINSNFTLRPSSIALLSQFTGAVGGWSLRNIGVPSNYGGNVVRVRRSSDDAEQDFTASQVAGSGLTDWVNEDVVLYSSDFSSGVDTFTINTGVTGSAPESVAGVDNAIKVTSDASSGQHFVNMAGPFNADGSTVHMTYDYYIPSSNTAVDGVRLWNGFGVEGSADGVVLDAWTTETATITNTSGNNLRFQLLDGGSISFAGTSGDVAYFKNIVITQTDANGAAVTVYDQTGNGKHWTTTTDSEQSLVVEGGSLVVNTNGQPGFKFDGVDDEYPDVISFDGEKDFYFIAVDQKAVYPVDANTRGALFGDGVNMYVRYTDSLSGEVEARLRNSADNALFTADEGVATAGDDVLRIVEFHNGSDELVVASNNNDSVAVDSSGYDGQLAVDCAVGSRRNSDFYGGIICEMIICTNDNASNRDDIKQKINSYYGVY